MPSKGSGSLTWVRIPDWETLRKQFNHLLLQSLLIYKIGETVLFISECWVDGGSSLDATYWFSTDHIPPAISLPAPLPFLALCPFPECPFPSPDSSHRLVL